MYRVIKVEKAPNPEDIAKDPITYYVIDAGKDQGVKAGDLFKIFRRVRDGGKEYSLFVGEVQAIESYENVSVNQLHALVDPAVFPVAHYHTVMLGDRAEPFSPAPKAQETAQDTGKLIPSAQDLTSRPSEKKVEEEMVAYQVDVASAVFFDLNKSEIRDEAKETLKDIAGQIRNFGGKILIEGHTCDLGTDAHNMVLSKNRANAVADYLVSEEKISRERLQTKGFGEKFPVNPRGTEEERALNRRVEFKFLEE